MRTRFRPLVASACIAFVAASCSAEATSSSEPPVDRSAPDGAVTTDSGTYEAEIVRTTDGVPHITGATLDDVTFGQGWASAEDRSCDLMDQIVRIRGDRARIFGAGDGDEHLTSDLQWRTIGIFDRASEDFTEESPDVRALLTAFTAGWNEHLAEVGVDDIAGWCSGEDWVRPIEAAEVYAYARAIALQASSGAIAGFLVGAVPPTTTTDATTDATTDEGAISGFDVAHETASNGWAIGADRSATGGGLLLGNPHFPWEGALRFWEVHLTVPDELDIYGAQLSGLPGIGIGFTERLAWTHTVSAGNRFTGYTLDLVPGSPTTYVYGDEEREMESETIAIDVLADDGTITTETRTVYRTHYGPVLAIPGLGWSDTRAVTYRDANIDNDEFIDQYLAMNQADDLDEFIAAHERISGVPLFNTIAVSDDGRAWYADTSATPNLSDETLAGWLSAREDDPVVGLAAEGGLVLLDGSDPANEWVEADDARDPGLVPFAAMPMTERSDVVLNANDSFWVSHPTEFLRGDYSPLHGEQDVEQSPRTRQNATALAGDDALDLASLRDLALENVGATQRFLREDLVARCRANPTIVVPDDPDDERRPVADGPVDLTEACDVLDAWDGTYDLDSVGPHLWREWVGGVDRTTIYETAFDPVDPVGTPTGLATAGADGADVALEQLGVAVLTLERAGLPLDRPWGEIQYADRAGRRIPIHGGDDRDGTTNIVRDGGTDTLEDLPDQGERVSPSSGLRPGGHPVASGSSFVLAVGFAAGRPPDAYAFLTYSNTQDRGSDVFVTATERFSAKDWRPVAFTDDDIAATEVSRRTVRN